LAVAFRSFPRRLREALALAEGDPARTRAAKDRAAELDRIVQDAAATVGASAGADLAAGTEAVAKRIQSIEPDEWDESRPSGSASWRSTEGGSCARSRPRRGPTETRAATGAHVHSWR
jgi:hypothetical protein